LENQFALDQNSDESLQLVTGQIFIGYGILVAHQIGLFEALVGNSLSLHEISTKLGIDKRAAQALISCACALELIKYHEGYTLSPIGKIYLDKNNPEYYGKVFDLLIQEKAIMTFDHIKEAIISNKPQINNGKDLFSNENSLSNTKSFIASLHQKSFKPAFYWSKIINLSGCHRIIDIGGGSGIHTIAACINNPELSGLVCDRQSVIPYSKEYVENFNLQDRISVSKIDLWTDNFPEGDVCFFGDIFHDWPRGKCLILAKKAYKALPENGLIVLHEMLFNSEKTAPSLTCAYNIKMMLWTEGQQFSCLEIESILAEAGFKDISIQKSLGNWSIISGVKKLH